MLRTGGSAKVATAVLSFAVLLAGLAAPAWGIDVAAYPPKGYLTDYANVVDAQHKQELENYCARVEQATGVQLALLTFPSLEGEDLDRWANDWYRKWGVGSKKDNEGVLVLVVPNDRRVRIEVGYGVEPIIPDALAGQIVRSMSPALREKQYGAAFAEAANTLGSRIAAAKNVEIGSRLTRRRARRADDGIPWPLLLGLGIFIIFALISRSSGRGGRGRYYRGGRGGGMGGILPGVIIGDMMHGGSGRGGGGFGDYDGGGGFGGFGGGDSGGGGASGSW